MKEDFCEFENKRAENASAAIRDENFAAHLKQCSKCREAFRVADWMQRLAAETAPSAKLPTAGFLFWKSKIIEKQRAAQRAAKPIFWMETAAIVLISIAMLWLAVKNQTRLEPVWNQIFASLELVAAPFFIALTVGAFAAGAFFIKSLMRKKNH